jgi:hypothetical protein
MTRIVDAGSERGVSGVLRTCFKYPSTVGPMQEFRQMKRASLSLRLAALFLDWMVATFSTAMFYPLFASSLEPSLARLGVFVLEVGLLTALTGASIGQRILGLRVVSYPDQLFITPGAAFLRTFLLVLVIPPLVQDEESRGLHERFTKSQVVRVRN